MHAQLQGREGLRPNAEDVLRKTFQEELGLTSISAAQLSRMHKQVNPELLQQVFERLVKWIFAKSFDDESGRGRDYRLVKRWLSVYKSTKGQRFARQKRASNSICAWHLSVNMMLYRTRRRLQRLRRRTALSLMSLSSNLLMYASVGTLMGCKWIEFNKFEEMYYVLTTTSFSVTHPGN
ncbi:hypothetical protein [Paenibacillus sp. P22]|uniref:hypothetical protein n=1 Tax=Paenibacillus sp. P22 TaxID=483908 RepID=UPI0012EE020D|nr:hypothetical protein [Paenibacillus sp. P22]